jgi:hypothetical protein
MIVSVGCFNGGLVGLECAKGGMDVMYAYYPSTACIRSLFNAGDFLVSGGVDENLRIYAPRQLAELGTVLVGEGSINTIVTHKAFVLAGSDSGVISIFRTKDWSLLHSFIKHK